MPEDIDQRLRAEGLRGAYDARPPYQRNDYLGWIALAKRSETRQKRIDQMCDELAGGHLYMKMVWRKG
ncbi:YdeI/OmpD-associated family protein [Aliiroseovarius sp. S253]|uniref:YdeI/OmpD-associated family protein n=1 Tax=Aliiroseovarius sp. S253 TaxID=3415133 RepID=UPI003C7B8FFB